MTDKPAHKSPFSDIAPALGDIRKCAFWRRVEPCRIEPARPQPHHGRSLISLYRTNELPFHLKRALENGVTREELSEVITHLAFYAGWPPASTAVTIAPQVFEETHAS